MLARPAAILDLQAVVRFVLTMFELEASNVAHGSANV